MKQSIIVDTLRVMYHKNDLPSLLDGKLYHKIYSKSFLITFKRTNHYEMSKRYKNVFLLSAETPFQITEIGFIGYDVKDKMTFNDDYIQINFKKSFLYTNNFTQYIDVVQKSLSLTLHNITRIDIALDTDENIIKKFWRLVRSRKNFVFSLRKEVKSIAGAFTFSLQNKRYTNSIYISSKTKTLCIYDKTTQINKSKSLSDKIVSQYLQRNFASNNVTRVEVRLKSTELTKYQKGYTSKQTIKTQLEIDLLRLDERDYLMTIFDNKLISLIKIRKIDPNYYKKRYNLCQKIDLLNLNYNEITINQSVSSQVRLIVNVDVKKAFDEMMRPYIDIIENIKLIDDFVKNNDVGLNRKEVFQKVKRSLSVIKK